MIRALTEGWQRFTPLALVLALGVTGCSVTVVDDEEALLTVEWTLDDTFDPLACLDYDARYLELLVYDRYDYLAADVLVPCEDFAASVELPEGRYEVEATLLDRSRRAVTTTVVLGVALREGTEEFEAIDFPIDSLL